MGPRSISTDRDLLLVLDRRDTPTSDTPPGTILVTASARITWESALDRLGLVVEVTANAFRQGCTTDDHYQCLGDSLDVLKAAAEREMTRMVADAEARARKGASP